MAERTTQSWTTVPHFFVVREVDAGALVEVRGRLGSAIEKARGIKLTHTDFLVALIARVLVKHPRMNASWSGAGISLNHEVNIGVAMAVEDGVVATVIHNANKADLGEIAVQRRDLDGAGPRQPLTSVRHCRRNFYYQQPRHVPRRRFQCDYQSAAGGDSRGGKHCRPGRADRWAASNPRR